MRPFSFLALFRFFVFLVKTISCQERYVCFLEKPGLAMIVRYRQNIIQSEVAFLFLWMPLRTVPCSPSIILLGNLILECGAFGTGLVASRNQIHFFKEKDWKMVLQPGGGGGLPCKVLLTAGQSQTLFLPWSWHS